MELWITASYQGDQAEGHRLPAYEAAKSLYGLSRALLITVNYLTEGKVRHRQFRRDQFRLEMVAQRPGSFETVFELITRPEALTIGGTLAAAFSATMVRDFVKSMFSRSVGGGAEESIEELEGEQKIAPGDLIALVDAIAPAMRAVHEPIDDGAHNIELDLGREQIANFDRDSKQYLLHSVRDPDLRLKMFTVASFNANTGYGRVFDMELGHTVPFQLGQIDPKSIDVMLESMALYTRKRWAGGLEAAAVAIKYYATLSIDGRVKKIFPVEVAKDIADFRASPF